MNDNESTGHDIENRIFLIGFMGSGKTYWGQQIAEKMALPFFDLDVVIALTENKTITEIFEVNGEEYFRYKEKEILQNLIADQRQCIISCGGGTPCFFNNIDLMKENGKVVWLHTPVDVIVGRLLKEKTKRPLINSIPDDQLKTHILKKLQDRKIYYEQADIIVHENDLTMNKFLQILANA